MAQLKTKNPKTIAGLFLIAPVLFRLSWSSGCTPCLLPHHDPEAEEDEWINYLLDLTD